MASNPTNPMMSPISSEIDEESGIDYVQEMANASVYRGRGKALPWTSKDTIVDYDEVDVLPKHFSKLQKTLEATRDSD